VAGDDDASSALDIVEDAEELCFGFRCLYRLHRLTSQFDWLKYSRLGLSITAGGCSGFDLLTQASAARDEPEPRRSSSADAPVYR
jgi:hypothetical protein